MKHVVPHHFDSAEQAYSSSKLGMWLFLVTEILLFGGLFVAYIVFRAMYPDLFEQASTLLSRPMGTINTAVLIASSFTMAMAVNSSQKGDSNKSNQYLLITFFCGLIFMMIKYMEYSHKFHLGTLPGTFYTYEGFTHPKAPMFFGIYFMMTGLHGFHVLIGMGLILWCLIRSNKGHFGPKYYTPVENTGIYWHLVDLIWIYLFPLMYLIG